MKMTRTAMVLGALATSYAMATVSWADTQNDQDVRATTVPATSCQPQSNSSDNKLRLVNGAWTFMGDSTGSAQLWCPLPINQNTTSDDEDDNHISGYRIFYRDSDGSGSRARVETRLGYRHSGGFSWAGPLWLSTDEDTGNRFEYHESQHDLGLYLYSFFVVLSRADETEEAVFGGIDFQLPQPE